MNSCQSFQAQPIARGRRCHGNGWPLRASKFTAFQFPRNVWTSPTAASEQVQRHGGSKIIKLILIYSFDLFIFSKMSRLNIPDASCIALSGKSVSEFKLITKWHKIISKLPEHIWGWKQAVHTDSASDVFRFLFSPLFSSNASHSPVFFLISWWSAGSICEGLFQWPLEPVLSFTAPVKLSSTACRSNCPVF